MEMGLLVGTPVELVRFAPLGDPVEIKVRGYHLTLAQTRGGTNLGKAANKFHNVRCWPSTIPPRSRSPSAGLRRPDRQSELRQNHPVQRAHRPARQSRQLRRRHRRTQRRPLLGAPKRIRSPSSIFPAPTASARNRSTNRFRATCCFIGCRSSAARPGRRGRRCFEPPAQSLLRHASHRARLSRRSSR